MKNDVIELISISQTQNANGFPIEDPLYFPCFAEIKNAKRSEFYAASEAGYEVRYVVVVNEDDYKACKDQNGRPTKVRFDGDKYKILREYRTDKQTVELTLIAGDK